MLQQQVANIARDSCKPAIPVSISPHKKDGKLVLIVEIRRSLARPHFLGPAYVRFGSETRMATDAEIMLLRAKGENRKFGILKDAFEKGKLFVTLAQPGQADPMVARRRQAKILDVTPDWIILDMGMEKPQSFSLTEFELGFDQTNDHIEIRYRKSPT